VDLDTHRVHGALLEHGQLVATLVCGGQGKLAGDRFPSIMQTYACMIPMVRPDLIVIEDTPFVRNRAGFSGLAQILGGLRALTAQVAPQAEVRVLAGRNWKRALGLSGNANKAMIAAWVFAETGGLESLDTQDLVDAYAIARAGARLYA